MKTILVPIDYSVVCQKALEVALNLASRVNAQLLLCHIYQPPELASEEDEDEHIAEPMFAMTDSDCQKKALIRLREFVKRVKENNHTKVPVLFTVKAGSIVKELHKLIKERSVMMVVMGIKDQSSFLNKVFGSTTKKIMKEADCPVLAVPERAQANPFGNIVYATALEPYEESALMQLGQVSKLFHATLTVLYVEDKRLQEQANITVRKNNLLKNFKETEVVYSQLKSKDVAEGIEKFVKLCSADLVAFTVSQHSFWQDLFRSSVTSRLLYELDLPLLAFPVDTLPIDLRPEESQQVSA